MTVQALPGNVRFRAFQLGLQTTFGTPVNATRRMPWRYNPTVDPKWTYPDVDTGTLDPAIAPYRTATDVTGQSTGPLDADSAIYLWGALLKGSVAPTGPTDSAYAWQYSPASTSADSFETFSGEWGDEVTGDQFGYGGGVLDQLQLEYPQDLGPVMHTGDWRFATVAYPQTMTSGLVVPSDPPWLYAADTTLYVNDTAGSIGISPLANTLHGATVQVQNNLDVKRFANGSNSNFAVAGYGRGARMLQATFTLAKSTPALAEVVKWLNANPQERYVALDTTTRKSIGVTSKYSHRVRFAGYWFTRSEQAVSSNSAIQLVMKHVYDPNLSNGPIDVRVVNSRSGY